MAERAAVAQRSLQDLRIELGILTDRIALSAGLRPSDLAVLDVVAHDGPVSPGHLARRTGVHPATLTGVLARLEREGWLERTRDASDGRASVIRAVPARLKVLQRLYAPVDRRLARATKDVTAEHWKAIIDYLEATRAVVQASILELQDDAAGSRA